MSDQLKVVAWLRNERGDFEGPQTLDPLVMLGEPVAVGHHGATYEPLVTLASANARIAALEAALDTAMDNLRDHGENCFLHSEGEYDACFCGKNSLVDHLQSVLEGAALGMNQKEGQ